MKSFDFDEKAFWRFIYLLPTTWQTLLCFAKNPSFYFHHNPICKSFYFSELDNNCTEDEVIFVKRLKGFFVKAVNLVSFQNEYQMLFFGSMQLDSSAFQLLNSTKLTRIKYSNVKLSSILNKFWSSSRVFYCFWKFKMCQVFS